MPTAHEEVTTLSPEASRLLAVAEDDGKHYEDRIEAVFELWKRKEAAAADRLIKLLPGDYDAFTSELVNALGELRNPKALPALEKLYLAKVYEHHGKIMSALVDAIRECGGDPDLLDDPK